MATLFSKVVTEMDVTRSLSISISSLGLIPLEEGPSMDMHVFDDDSGRLWDFRCSIQHNTYCEGRVISVDWLEFVGHKNVRVDDKVIFVEQVTNDQSMRLKVEVKRRIRLFGQDIWAAVR